MGSTSNEASGVGDYFGRDLEAMSLAVNYHQWVVAEFGPYLGGRVAEVGAGTGNCTRLLLEANPQIGSLVAFEPSCNMYPLLEERVAGLARVRTVQGLFGDDQADSGGRFDTIVYINVLEHVENDERELSLVHGSLQAGGHVLILVPALPSLYSDLDMRLGHFRRYRKQGLIDIVQDAGLSVLKAKYFDLAGIVPWYLAYVLMRKTISGRDVALYDRVVVPLMRRIEGVVAPPVGKNLLVVGRRS